MAFPAGCIPGIDVSHFNGSIEWPTAYDAGEAFAYIKASDGAETDDAYFIDSWHGSGAAKLLRGAYHFFRPEQDAAAQAHNFLARLTAANGSPTLKPGDLPAALDVEVLGGQTAATIIAGMTTWLAAVEAATGRTPLIYTYANFWIHSVGHVAAFSRYPLWIARYGAAPVTPATWPRWTMWQFSTQQVAWHQGAMDSNAFHGDLNSLRALAGLPAAAPTETVPMGANG